ncbi:DMT family transporter [Affinibrenneria salicis]|uniref:DMT family transporter n=1 Tax=Affinibrenneria salicis TaxID=2590031 RepID=A0A5J5FXU5_9GAMM|nr:DMT family transporter [Affinibrenneria salicis]KAA8998925.1 DMT family transporter [Affinibrenneria salicis]
MYAGVLFALLAGLMWGLIFVAPALLPDYPAALMSVGRYLALGVISLPLAWYSRRALRELTRADWIEAFKLSAIGNLIYYFCLSGAIQRAGAPVSTMIIATLPVVIAIAANLLYSRQDGKLSWWRLAPSLLLIAAGLTLVNLAEMSAGMAADSLPDYLAGIGLAVLALLCWTWYPLRNARWMRRNPTKKGTTWATAQGLVTLPLSLIGLLLLSGQMALSNDPLPLPFGPRPQVFIPLMIAIALFCSWLGALCWNEASQRLPTVLLGPLTVFETLAGLAYIFILRQTWPPLLTLAGVACLMAGVIYAMRSKPKPVVVKI